MSLFNLFRGMLFRAAFTSGAKAGTAIAKGLSGRTTRSKLTAKQLEDRSKIQALNRFSLDHGLDHDHRIFYETVTLWAEDNPSDFAREYLAVAVQNDATLRNAPEAVLAEVSRRIRTTPDFFRKTLGEYLLALKHIEKNHPDMFAKIKAGHPR